MRRTAAGRAFKRASFHHEEMGRTVVDCSWAPVTPVPAVNAQEPPKPIRALLVLGGCCHDYARQKDILTRGISQRAHVEWTIAYDPTRRTRHKNPVYDNPDWAKGFDVIVHDECSARSRHGRIDTILKPHKDGLPGVVLHCAMHCYRTEGWNRKIATPWMQFTGLDLHRARTAGAHRGQLCRWREPDHQAACRLDDRQRGALQQRRRQARADGARLARGKQGRAESIVAWTNTYNGKTRVFGTTLGHNNATVADPRYLDLVTRGLLWAVDKLDDRYLKDPDLIWSRKTSRGKAGDRLLDAEPRPSARRPPSTATPRPAGAPDGPSSPQWWQVDLGKPEDLTGIRIFWEQDGVAYRYKVEGSDDGKSWTMLSDQTRSTSATRTARTNSSPGASGTSASPSTGLAGRRWASIFEVQVFGTKKVAGAGGEDAAVPRGRSGGPATTACSARSGAARVRGDAVRPPPDVRYPTCLAAAPTGEVFVGVDENGSLDAKPGRGRVVRCIDGDGDGKADKFNVFAKMDSPRGVVFDAGTLYVLHPPDLTAYHDDNGDGVADRSETLVKGIGFDLKFRGADHTTNGIRLGIDGYIYVAVGDYGFVKAVGKDGTTLQLRGGGIVRVRTDGSGLEVVSRGQRNIYDVAVDPY